MEKILNCCLALIVLPLFMCDFALGQMKPHENPKYGPDSVSRVKCASNLSSVSEFMKINVPSYAVESWWSVYRECPAASKNIYIHGVKIVKYLIDEAETEEEKQSLIDTLMAVYDKRIQYFSEEGKVLGRKAIDLLKYRKENIDEAYGYLEKSVQLRKERTENVVFVTFMQLTSLQYKMNKFEADKVIDNFMLCMQYLDKKKQKGRDKDIGNIMATVESIFSDCGAATCDDLISIFTARFENGKEDVDFLKRTIQFLDKTKCDECDLYANMVEQLYTLEPSAESAYHLAKLFVKREEYQKSAKYYQEAVNLEEEPVQKAQNYYELAVVTAKLNDKPMARSYAYKALELKPDWGEPYILIGNLYVVSGKSCGENDFESGTVYWVAVDKFVKAKSVDHSISEQANEYIAKYKQYYPDKEKAFFHGYTEGQTYNVGCWINETTQVRFN